MTSVRGSLLLACAVFVNAITLPARAQDQNESPWRFSLQGEYWYGHVSGFAQTPLGGEPNTTSHQRPTFGEVGINNASIYDLSLNIGYHNEELYGGAQIIRLSGGDTLDTDLTTHGELFPAGTHVSSDVDLDWYRFGYRHRFSLSQWDLTFWPAVGVGILDFNYKLHSSANSTDRSYIKVSPQLGLETEWRPGGGPFSLDLNLLGSLPITPPLPEMFVEELTARYRLIHDRKLDLTASLGVAFEQIRYEDNQTVSNHIQADFGPMLVAGLEFRF